MRTTIEMAREAGLRDCTCNGTKGCLERFTEIVRADERAMMAEQPAQQEPCKACNGTGETETGIGMMVCDECHGTTYTSPPAQRTWVGLTDEEIKQAMDYWSSDEHSAYGGAASAAGEYFDVETSWRYIEAKLKEKNNG